MNIRINIFIIIYLLFLNTTVIEYNHKPFDSDMVCCFDWALVMADW